MKYLILTISSLILGYSVANARDVEYFDENHIIVDGMIMSIDYIESQFKPQPAVLAWDVTPDDTDTESGIGATECADCQNNVLSQSGFELLKAGRIDGARRRLARGYRNDPEFEEVSSIEWRYRVNSVVSVFAPFRTDENGNDREEAHEPRNLAAGTGFVTGCDTCILTTAHTFFANFGKPNERLRGNLNHYSVVVGDDVNGKYSAALRVKSLRPYSAHAECESADCRDLAMIQVESFDTSVVPQIELKPASVKDIARKRLVQVGFHSDIGNGSLKQVQICQGKSKGERNIYYWDSTVAIGHCSSAPKASGLPYFNLDGSVSAIHLGSRGGHGPFDPNWRYVYMRTVTDDVIEFRDKFARDAERTMRRVRAIFSGEIAKP